MEANNLCTAVTIKGEPCHTRRSSGTLCTVHSKCRTAHGPNQFEIEQLRFKYNRELRDLKDQFTKDAAILMGADGVGYTDRKTKYHVDRTQIRARYLKADHEMCERHRKAIEETGVDPDQEAKDIQRRKAEAKRETEVRRAQRFALENAERQARFAQERAEREAEWARIDLERAEQRRVDDQQWRALLGMFHVIDPVVFAPAEPVVARAEERDLRAFANDRQNIHTVEAVNHTKSIIEKIRAVAVPEDYRWNEEICSKTPGEIIAECRLSQKAAHQMMAQYAQNTAIYDIEAGIYGKVLDSVWQFIKTHTDRADLVDILRTELQDNIGMCAQGNLTRICNIVAGYLDGVSVAESLAEKLGRILPPLREIEDIDERRYQVGLLLTENKVPVDEWGTWVEAVMD